MEFMEVLTTFLAVNGGAAALAALLPLKTIPLLDGVVNFLAYNYGHAKNRH
jgi:hypothetical protein